MPVNLSIKNVPDDLADQLRRRAAASHRSLQGELIEILEKAVEGERRITIGEALKRVRRMGLETASEAVEMIRGDRDAR
jgi:plasmid stability protein